MVLVVKSYTNTLTPQTLALLRATTLAKDFIMTAYNVIVVAWASAGNFRDLYPDYSFMYRLLVWFPDPSCMGGARKAREGRVW